MWNRRLYGWCTRQNFKVVKSWSEIGNKEGSIPSLTTNLIIKIMRNIKQIKASKRNFAIMYLVGVTIVLERIIKSTRNYAIKGSLTSIKWSIYDAINLLRDTDYEHSFYGPQKDVNYECKQSNQ